MAKVISVNQFTWNSVEGYPLPEGHSTSTLGPWSIAHVAPVSMCMDSSLDAGRPVEVLLYLPGSGTSRPSTGGNVIDRFLSEMGPQGVALSTAWSGSLFENYNGSDFSEAASFPKIRSARPVRYGYGNVNSPLFSSGWAKSAHHARMMVETIKNTGLEIAGLHVIGHSAGSTAWLSLLAGYAGDYTLPEYYRGCVLNAPTQAGLGTGSFNAPHRLVNEFSQMMGRHLPGRTILTYADNDLYAPPDMRARYTSCIPPDANTWVLSPGAGGHNWYNDEANMDMLFRWVHQIRDGSTITRRDGITPASRGPALLEET